MSSKFTEPPRKHIAETYKLIEERFSYLNSEVIKCFWDLSWLACHPKITGLKLSSRTKLPQLTDQSSKATQHNYRGKAEGRDKT